MRKILALLGIVLLALIAIPFGMGFLAKGIIENYIKVAELPPEVTVSITDYQRGFFSSKANIEVHIAETTSDVKQPLILKGPLDIKHGPIILDNTDPAARKLSTGLVFVSSPVSIDFDAAQAHIKLLLQDVLHGDPLFYLSGKTSLMGNIQFKMITPAIVVDSAERKINWGGLKGTFELSRNQQHFSSDINITPLEINIANLGTIKTGHAELQSSSKKGNFDLWTGDAQLILDSLSTITARHQIELAALNVELKTTEGENSTIESVGVTKFSELRINAQDYGSLSTTYSINGLDQASFAQLREYLDQFQSTDLDPNTVALKQDELGQKMLQLFYKGSTLQINNFALDTPYGPFKLDANWQVHPAITGTEALAAPVKNIAELVKQSNAGMNAQVSEELAKKIVYLVFVETLGPFNQLLKHANEEEKAVIQKLLDKEVEQILATMQKNKLVQKQDNLYTISLEFKEGQVYVNQLELSKIDLNGLL